MNNDLNNLEGHRYPIGRFTKPVVISGEQQAASIATIIALPEAMSMAVKGLDDARIDTPYREGGWSVRQLVHHVADSHINAYTRFRLALTEDFPNIKAYEEKLWAELADASSAPIGLSLDLLAALHARWGLLLKSLSPDDFENRGYTHPALGRQTLGQVLALYDWHSRHHTAHIVSLRSRKGW